MKMNQIQALKKSFLDTIQAQKNFPYFHLRHAIQIWQNKFDIDADDFPSMLESCLQSETSGRLWEGNQHSIKSGLLDLAAHSSDLMRSSFLDLFNDRMEISMRLSRFVFHCDQIFSEIKSDVKKKNTHYQSYYSASLFLSMAQPHVAIPFQYDEFQRLMKLLETHNLPSQHETERYFKSCQSLGKVIQNDEEFMSQYYARLDEDCYLGPSISIVWEMMEYLKMQA